MPGTSPSSGRLSISGSATAPLPIGVAWMLKVPRRFKIRTVWEPAADANVARPCVNEKAKAPAIRTSVTKLILRIIALLCRPPFIFSTPIVLPPRRILQSRDVDVRVIQKYSDGFYPPLRYRRQNPDRGGPNFQASRQSL